MTQLRVKKKKVYKDGNGWEIPLKHMQEVNILKDFVSTELVQEALELEEKLRQFKMKAFSLLTQYRQRTAKINRSPDPTGGITVTSFDGSMKVEQYSHEFIDFGEGLCQAKTLMGEVLLEGSNNLNPALQQIFLDAFNVNKGQINVSKILNLCTYKVDDSRWRQAVKIINEDKTLRFRKQYIRCQTRSNAGDWETVYLDISKIPVSFEPEEDNAKAKAKTKSKAK